MVLKDYFNVTEMLHSGESKVAELLHRGDLKVTEMLHSGDFNVTEIEYIVWLKGDWNVT